MKLYGNPMSTCTRKVLFALHETRTPFDLEVLDFMKGDHKAPAHVARQPFGQMPAVDDDGFAMYESRAICRYIDDKTGHTLSATDARTRAIVEQFISIEQSDYSPNAMKFVYHHVMHRAQTPETLEAAGKMVTLCYEVIDRQVASRPYLAGDHLTIADICFAPYLEYLDLTPAKELLAPHANAVAWWARVSDRPAWRKTIGRA